MAFSQVIQHIFFFLISEDLFPISTERRWHFKIDKKRVRLTKKEADREKKLI